jgi:membrane protein YqaA with SNARE-associated domain
MEWIKELAVWVAHFAYTPYGPWALFALAFAESSFFPIPPDVLLMALCAMDPAGSFWFATVCTVGSTLGGMFGYLIGIKGGRPLMYRFFSHEKIKLVEGYYQRYDVWAVGAAGLTPLPYKLFTITAGVFDLNFPRFVLASVLSRGARFYAVGTIFWLFGPAIHVWIKQYFGWVAAGFFVCLVGGFWLVHHLGRRAAKQEERR